MIIYEITATVGEDLIEAYEKYMLERHIPDLLATGFFAGAKMARAAGENRYRIQYEAFDQKALDEYLATEAARLRADFIEHFPDGIEVARENWEVLMDWKKD